MSFEMLEDQPPDQVRHLHSPVQNAGEHADGGSAQMTARWLRFPAFRSEGWLQLFFKYLE